MAAALRLITLLLALCAVFLSMPSRAAVLPPGDVSPKVKTVYCVGWTGNPNGTCYESGTAACQAAGPHYWDPASNTYSYQPSNNMCYVNDTYTFTGVSVKNGPTCPTENGGSVSDPAVPDGSACKCNTGFADAGGANCRESTDADCPPSGTDVGGTDNVFPRQPTGGSCVGGCQVRGSGSACGAGGALGYACYTYGPYTSMGKACSSSANQLPAAGGQTTANCVKSGGLPGTVNGVAVCTPASSTSSTSTTNSTSTSASGASSGSSTTTETTDNKDGSTTTTTTTTNSDGSTTHTTTTSPTPSGAASGVGSPDQSSDTCKLHPDLAMCKNSSFGGTCQTLFTCDGDAVQCAIAKEQHARDCDFYDPANSQNPNINGPASRYTQAVTDGDKPSWSPTSSTGGASDAILDMQAGIKTDKHWGAECVADQVLTLSKFSATIPWSSWCSQMQMIGNLVLAVTALVCVGIVFKN